MNGHAHLGMAEIAKLLGVSRQRVYQLRKTYRDFPEPAAELVLGSIWHEDDIRAWHARHPVRLPGRHLDHSTVRSYVNELAESGQDRSA